MPYGTGAHSAQKDKTYNSTRKDNTREDFSFHAHTIPSNEHKGDDQNGDYRAIVDPQRPAHLSSYAPGPALKKHIGTITASELLLHTKDLKHNKKKGASLNMLSPLDRMSDNRRALPRGQPRGCNCA